MSITSLINPSGYPSSQDDLWHIATSDNSGQTDFKYVFDIFKGSQQLIRVKLFPDIDTGKGYFNASSIIKNEFTYDWFNPISSDLMCNNLTDENKLTYNVRVGEDFSGVTTLNMASGNVSVYNWMPPLFKRRQNDISTKLYQWFTNRHTKIKAGINDKILIPYYSTGGDINFAWETYSFNNVLLDDGITNITSTGNEFLQLDIGANSVNTINGFNYIDAYVWYYKIRIKNADDNEYSEWITVYLDCNPLYTTFNLYFINQYGMFDTARFSKASRLNMSTERKAYQRKEYDFKPSSVEYYDTNNVYKESKINYGSKSNWTYKLTMDFPTDEEYEWLSELITSPQIYAEIDGDYYPVTLMATNYEYSKFQNNGLRVFEVEIELNQTRNGFRR